MAETFTTKVEVEIECANCGESLTTSLDHRNDKRILVTPCRDCMNDARQEGRDEAEAEAK